MEAPVLTSLVVEIGKKGRYISEKRFLNRMPYCRFDFTDRLCSKHWLKTASHKVAWGLGWCARRRGGTGVRARG